MPKPVLAQQSYVDEGFLQLKAGFDHTADALEKLAELVSNLASRVNTLERELDTERRLRLAMKR